MSARDFNCGRWLANCAVRSGRRVAFVKTGVIKKEMRTKNLSEWLMNLRFHGGPIGGQENVRVRVKTGNRRGDLRSPPFKGRSGQPGKGEIWLRAKGFAALLYGIERISFEKSLGRCETPVTAFDMLATHYGFVNESETGRD